MAIITLCIMATGPHAGAEDHCSFDRDFFSTFERTSAIQRDAMLEGCLNKIVMTTGTVESVVRLERFKKKFRVILVVHENDKVAFRVRVHLYSDQVDTIGRISSGDRFQFTGQLIAVTPVNSRRTAYILDMILEKGAILVE